MAAKKDQPLGILRIKKKDNLKAIYARLNGRSSGFDHDSQVALSFSWFGVTPFYPRTRHFSNDWLIVRPKRDDNARNFEPWL
jgi:hypothetical protein